MVKLFLVSSLKQGYTNTMPVIALVATLHHCLYIFSTITAVLFSPHTEMFATSHAPRKKHQTTVKFVGQCIVVGPQCSILVALRIWR